MSIALVQSALGTNTSFAFTSGAGGSGSVSVSLASTGAGNLIYLVAYAHMHITSGSIPPGGFLTPTGGTGLTWRQVVNATFSTASDRVQGIPFFVGNAGVQTSPTFTVQYTVPPGSGTGTAFVEVTAYEFSGTAASNSASVGGPLVDVDAQLNGQPVGTPHTANLSTTKTDLIISIFTGNGSAIAAGPGFALGQTAANLSGGIGQLQYALNVSPGSNATAFIGTQTNWGCCSISFMPPAVTAFPFSEGSLIGF